MLTMLVSTMNSRILCDKMCIFDVIFFFVWNVVGTFSADSIYLHLLTVDSLVALGLIEETVDWSFLAEVTTLV